MDEVKLHGQTLIHRMQILQEEIVNNPFPSARQRRANIHEFNKIQQELSLWFTSAQNAQGERTQSAEYGITDDGDSVLWSTDFTPQRAGGESND